MTSRGWLIPTCAASLAWTAVARAEPGAPAALAGVGVEQRLGAELPLDAQFRSSEGATLRLREVLGTGTPALLVLAYNRCEMLCSLVLQNLAALVRDLDGGDTFSVVTLSIDPTETPHEAARSRAVLLERAGRAPANGTWLSLVGQRSEIDAVARAVGFGYRWDPGTEQYAHPAVIFAISGAGRVAGYFQGLDPDRAAVRDALHGSAESPSPLESFVMSCFRFDPATTRFGAWINGSLRAAGAVLTLWTVSLLVWLSHRERQRERRGQR